jgi:hypothetical protein
VSMVDLVVMFPQFFVFVIPGRRRRTRNLEIPGSSLRDAPE